ncbi:MAG: S8 family peptidase, partial [Candidatus Kapaibacterium sp.]
MRVPALRTLRSLACLLLIIGATPSFAGDRPLYEEGTVIIKFRADAPEFDAWKAAGRSGEITELHGLLGAHTSEGYLGDGTLALISKRYNEQMRLFSGENPGLSLERIAVIHASAARNLSVLVKKASALAFIEYAELMPTRYLCLTPNDSLYADVGQYYIKNTKANEAWDQLPGSEKVVISVVDTGVDYLHEDLKDVMFTNAGETGKDANGNDKRSNKIDDDKNGFVDDWRGWDFAGATTGSPQDNDPMPGYMHGTHCAGIVGAAVNNRAGIAGMCHRASIMAVKIGTNNTALVRSYEGIAYSAGMGAPNISCSWGGGAASQAEQDVVTAATKLGSLVIVAAGNDGVSDLFYPAAYKNVLAVSAVGRNDAKANFSNYGSHVGIAAPGVFILSTVPGNGYDHSDGTSMATPCVAGAAGLVKLKYPAYTPDQISALLRA